MVGPERILFGPRDVERDYGVLSESAGISRLPSKQIGALRSFLLDARACLAGPGRLAAFMPLDTVADAHWALVRAEGVQGSGKEPVVHCDVLVFSAAMLADLHGWAVHRIIDNWPAIQTGSATIPDPQPLPNDWFTGGLRTAAHPTRGVDQLGLLVERRLAPTTVVVQGDTRPLEALVGMWDAIGEQRGAMRSRAGRSFFASDPIKHNVFQSVLVTFDLVVGREGSGSPNPPDRLPPVIQDAQLGLSVPQERLPRWYDVYEQLAANVGALLKVSPAPPSSPQDFRGAAEILLRSFPTAEPLAVLLATARAGHDARAELGDNAKVLGDAIHDNLETLALNAARSAQDIAALVDFYVDRFASTYAFNPDFAVRLCLKHRALYLLKPQSLSEPILARLLSNPRYVDMALAMLDPAHPDLAIFRGTSADDVVGCCLAVCREASRTLRSPHKAQIKDLCVQLLYTYAGWGRRSREIELGLAEIGYNLIRAGYTIDIPRIVAAWRQDERSAQGATAPATGRSAQAKLASGLLQAMREDLAKTPQTRRSRPAPTSAPVLSREEDLDGILFDATLPDREVRTLRAGLRLVLGKR